VKRALDTRQVLEDSTLVVLATVSGGAFLFVFNLYLARVFGPVEFGHLRNVISLVSWLTILVEFGTGPSLLKYGAELGAERTRDLVRRYLAFRGVLFLGLAITVAGFREPLARQVLKDPELDHYLIAGAVFVVFLYFDISKFIVLAHQRMKLFAGSTAATFLANGLLAAALTPAGGVFGAIVGWSLGYLVGNAMNVYYIVRSGALARGPKVDFKKILLGYGLPMQVEQTLRGAELAVIPLWSLFFAPAEIGALAFAMVFYRTVMSVIASINSVLLPRFARMSSEVAAARAALRQALGLYTAVAVPGSALALLSAARIITVIDGAYLPAVAIFRILVVYGLASGYVMIVGGYFTGLGRVRPAILATALQQGGLFLASYLALGTLR